MWKIAYNTHVNIVTKIMLCLQIHNLKNLKLWYFHNDTSFMLWGIIILRTFHYPDSHMVMVSPFTDYVILGHKKQKLSVRKALGKRLSAEETNSSNDDRIRGVLSSPPYLRMHLRPLLRPTILIRCGWKPLCPPSSPNCII